MKKWGWECPRKECGVWNDEVHDSESRPNEDGNYVYEVTCWKCGCDQTFEMPHDPYNFPEGEK